VAGGDVQHQLQMGGKNINLGDSANMEKAKEYNKLGPGIMSGNFNNF